MCWLWSCIHVHAPHSQRLNCFRRRPKTALWLWSAFQQKQVKPTIAPQPKCLLLFFNISSAIAHTHIHIHICTQNHTWPNIYNDAAHTRDCQPGRRQMTSEQRVNPKDADYFIKTHPHHIPHQDDHKMFFSSCCLFCMLFKYRNSLQSYRTNLGETITRTNLVVGNAGRPGPGKRGQRESAAFCPLCHPAPVLRFVSSSE